MHTVFILNPAVEKVLSAFQPARYIRLIEPYRTESIIALRTQRLDVRTARIAVDFHPLHFAQSQQYVVMVRVAKVGDVRKVEIVPRKMLYKLFNRIYIEFIEVLFPLVGNEL